MTTASQLLEKNRLNVRQWLIVAILTLALVLDGLDVKILSFAAPLILDEWNITKAIFGPVLAAALVGMAFGAWLGGRWGDRWGRRIVIILSLALFGATTMLAGATNDVTLMMVLRFLSGLGFGAVTPNAYALVSEWLPSRSRPLAVALLTIGSPLGGSAGALAALWLLPSIGWQGCFVAAGVATLILCAIALWLPESPSFLASKGLEEAATRQWLRVFRSDQPAPSFSSAGAETTAEVSSLRATTRMSLWQRSLFRTNIGSVVCFFSTHFVNYAVATWGTVIFTTAGVSLQDAISGGFFYNVLAVLFGFLTGPLLRITGSKSLVWINGLMIALLVGLMAFLLQSGTTHPSTSSKFILLAAFSLIGGFSGSLITVIAALASAAYPSQLRATGLGLGIMAGRVGGIASILAGGALLTLGKDNPSLLLSLLGALSLCITASAFIIDRHLASSTDATKRRSKRIEHI